MNQGDIVKNPADHTAEPTRNVDTYLPNVDILERADELLLLVDMPGVDPASIDVDFDAGALTISGQVESRQSEETRFLLKEFGVGDFHRAFRVSEDIDADKISAQYDAGVLRLQLPKAEAVKPRKITVAAN